MLNDREVHKNGKILNKLGIVLKIEIFSKNFLISMPILIILNSD